MHSILTRAVVFACLPLALASCCTPCLPCISGQMHTNPLYVDPESFRALACEINVLNHRFAPYETAMDHCVYPKRICNRLIQLDNDVLHVNAEWQSREVPPEKIQRQLDRIAVDLCRLETEIGVYESPDRCRKSPGMMRASLDAWLSRLRGKKAPGKPVLSATPPKRAAAEEKH